MRISDWSSDVCSSDLSLPLIFRAIVGTQIGRPPLVKVRKQGHGALINAMFLMRGSFQIFPHSNVAEILQQDEAVVLIARIDGGCCKTVFNQVIGDREDGAWVFMRRWRIHQNRDRKSIRLNYS